ncbi:hypothetical protein WT27_13455 [Burkholderia territorii]|uniref:Uncharacterized protein n=1 Tax=Burkholderia territorii TaxID=1503055 RepID=A0A106DR33_9BURK|nr:hypothetical protein [Burkholderia territorii]KVV40926.1 hypothetical protein WT27_13455 [Burkholderia territorii]KVX33873.1 hypothetical protein WT31_09355 [Burkholderia territorii]
MKFAILPMVFALAYMGITLQAGQLAGAVPGASSHGQMDNVAYAVAQQAELYGARCIEAAIAAPGLVSDNIPVTLPTGVAAPTSAGCMTRANALGGRDVYGWIDAPSGVPGQILVDSEFNTAWHRVFVQGSAVNLVTGQGYVVPSNIPAGTVVDWIKTNP